MRFTKKTATKKTQNLAGGDAYKITPQEYATTLVLTSFMKDQFYKSSTQTAEDLEKLMRMNANPSYMMKLGVYARTKYGLRSITHVLAAKAISLWKGHPHLKPFLRKVIHRPDDMIEILAYYNLNQTHFYVPNSLKCVIREKLQDMDEYTLAKYKCENKEIKMVDLVNLTHPKSTKALKKLMKGTLVSKDTWETRLTQAGQKAKDEGEDLDELKSEAWLSLLKEKKLGYFALLRNARNIIQKCPEGIPLLCKQLVNKEAIKKSLVLPFRYYTAAKALLEDGTTDKKVIAAIEEAVEIAVENVPDLDGKTLVCLDESGSMKQAGVDVFASVFAGILYKKGNTDIVTFASNARVRKFLPSDSMLRVTQTLLQDFNGGGTNFGSVFDVIKDTGYSRVIFLSDMQGWLGHIPQPKFISWLKKGNRPWIHSIDLAGHGTTQFAGPKACLMYGMSEKVLEMIPLIEEDKKALIKEIDKVVL